MGDGVDTANKNTKFPDNSQPHREKEKSEGSICIIPEKQKEACRRGMPLSIMLQGTL